MRGGIMSLSNWVMVLVFISGLGGAIYLKLYQQHNRSEVPVAARDLPAFQLIHSEDLTLKSFPHFKLKPGFIPSKKDLIGHYALNKIPQGQPFQKEKVGPEVDSVYLAKACIINLPTAPKQIIGGTLEAGNSADLFFPERNDSSGTSPGYVFENILIMAVHNNQAYQQPASVRGALVIALPREYLNEFISHFTDESVYFILKRN